MSRNYDNWERLVAAVIKREEIWQLCHQHSIRTPSICSEASSSDFSSSFRSDFELEEKQESLPKKSILICTQELSKEKTGKSTLTQLLRRKVKVLSKGSSQPAVPVMKKLVGEEEEYKIVFGDCRLENVAALFSENGNFDDYHPRISLHDLLHGKGNAKRNILHTNWESLLRVAVKAARGITHLHNQSLVHGNITSSNIFLNSHQYGRGKHDFYLAGILRMPEGVGGLHYHASEYEFKNASHESDVYSFGVVLLELLTGRSPLEDMHLVEWAHSITFKDWRSSYEQDRGTWASDLYRIRSSELILCDEIDGSSFQFELLVKTFEIFKVATRCVQLLSMDRPKMIEVMSMLEETYKHIFLDPKIFFPYGYRWNRVFRGNGDFSLKDKWRPLNVSLL